MAACNAGSLNYLKTRSDGSWAWPPMLFDNQPAKVQDFLDVMAETHTLPEFECFDVGIVRCVGMYVETGMYQGLPEYNFVMGWSRACRPIPICCPFCSSSRSGCALADHADRAQRNLATICARPSSADICAAGWRTLSICRTAAR